MDAILYDIVPRPSVAVRPGLLAVSPEIGSPGDERRNGVEILETQNIPTDTKNSRPKTSRSGMMSLSA